MKLYEVLVTNTVGEIWHIEAENEDDANNNYSEGDLVTTKTIVCDVEQIELINNDNGGEVKCQNKNQNPKEEIGKKAITQE